MITTQDVRLLMRAYTDSVALNTALELGLFWRLAERPQTAEEVARELGMPPHRSGPWLELLAGLGLLECHGAKYQPSPAARSAILDGFSRESWEHLAEEERYRYAFGVDLARNIGHPLSVWAGQMRMPHNYLLSIAEDPAFAWRFTHMLFELHRSLAESVAEALDMRDVGRCVDLGGGSGVVSLALLRRNPRLSAIVVDHPNVCAAGRAIAATLPEGDRITYQPGDFSRDALPAGCDLALACDVGVYNEAFFSRVYEALNPGGRLVIIDEFESPSCCPSPRQRRYQFYSAMTAYPSADSTPPSVGRIQALLARAGFQISVERGLDDGMCLIQGRK